MYEDDYGNLESADDITCPYCGSIYPDSYEYIPNSEDSDISWNMECEDCGKEFHVSFDRYNVNDGFNCKKICKKHNFVLKEKARESNYYKSDRDISKYDNYYVCPKCGEAKFESCKEDGTLFSKKEIKKWREIQRYKDHPELKPTSEIKKVTISVRDTCIDITTETAEGNEQLFKKINKFLKSKGFSIIIEDDYKIGGQFNILSRWNRLLVRDWLQCEAKFNWNNLSYEFFQDVHHENSNGGRFDFDKYEKMDLKQKVIFRSIRKAIIDFVSSICDITNPEVNIYDCHDYVGDPEKIDPKYPGKVIRVYSKKDFEQRYGEGFDINKIPVHNGDFLGAYDKHGRLVSGWLYARCGTYKFMVHNDKNYSLYRTDQCFRLTGSEPRKILPEDSVRKLKTLLAKSVEKQDFEKAIILRDVINGITS